MAVGVGGKAYVLGGYSGTGATLRTAFVLENGAWRALPRMPFPRAAAGVGVSGRRIVVAGGIGEARRLARTALVFDLRTRRWSSAPGPTPREHLGVTSFAGTVYAIAGRTAGLDTNLLHFESWRPGQSRWQRLQPIPDSRGGTGAAALRGQIVSAGGEEPDGTIREVLAYRIAEKRWVRLADLPTPRHGVGVAALGGRVYVIGGGPEPGLTVSSANESLQVSTVARRRPASAVRPSTLVFRRADGARISFPSRARAWCGAWSDVERTRALHVAVLPLGLPHWHLAVPVKHLARTRVVRFVESGLDGTRPLGPVLWVVDVRKSQNQATSFEEDARGRFAYDRATCVPGSTVRFSVEGILGSVYSDRTPIRVSGTFTGVVGAAPTWWPR